MDFEKLRKRMVEEQILSRGIKDQRVLAALSEVPRHEFIPGEYLSNAYADYPVTIGEGQTISQPYIVALMTESLELKGDEKILEIGTGSGYQTVILARLSKEVYTVERINSLAEMAERQFKKIGLGNIRVKVGDGTLGWEEHAPYDRIIVTAASPQVPPALLEQLKKGGIMVIPLGGTFSQMLTRLSKTDAGINTADVCACAFVPLIGKGGWKGKDVA